MAGTKWRMENIHPRRQEPTTEGFIDILYGIPEAVDYGFIPDQLSMNWRSQQNVTGGQE